MPLATFYVGHEYGATRWRRCRLAFVTKAVRAYDVAAAAYGCVVSGTHAAVLRRRRRHVAFACRQRGNRGSGLPHHTSITEPPQCCRRVGWELPEMRLPLSLCFFSRVGALVCLRLNARWGYQRTPLSSDLQFCAPNTAPCLIHLICSAKV